MDVREKLMELIESARYWGSNTSEEIAEKLLENGVTVQERVSVKDRMPEDDRDVLAYSSIGEESRIYPACYSNGVWFDCVFNAVVNRTFSTITI